MSAFLERDHGWGRQRVAARLVWCQRTQVGGNVGGLPLSVAGMRPSKTGFYSQFAALDQHHLTKEGS